MIASARTLDARSAPGGCGALLLAACLQVLISACNGETEDAGLDRASGDAPPIPYVDPNPEPAVAEFPEEAFRALMPGAGLAQPFSIPRPEVFRLPSGTEVMLVERHTLPIVSWSLRLPWGSIDDPQDKAGLTGLCVSLLAQGTAALPRRERLEVLGEMGSSVGVGASATFTLVSGTSLSPAFEATARVWADLLRSPALRQSDFEGLRSNHREASMTPLSLAPTAIASRVSSRLFWGHSHPNRRVPTAADFDRMTLSDCLVLLRSAYDLPLARLEVAGDITRAQVEQMLGAPLADLTGGPALETPPSPPMPEPGRLFFVDAPGATQSVVSLGAVGPAFGAPDHEAASVMASILAGSSITSRIGMNVREMRGYAYSSSGGFSFFRNGSAFTFLAPVRADATTESMAEVLEEIRKMRETLVSDEELNREREGRVAALPAGFETVGGIISRFSTLASYGVSDSYYDSYEVRLAAVTKEAVKEAAAMYMAPAQLQILVVGDARTVLPKLQQWAAGRADVGERVIILDPEGQQFTAPAPSSPSR